MFLVKKGYEKIEKRKQLGNVLLKMYVKFQQELYNFELLLIVDILRDAEIDEDRRDLCTENRLMMT